MPQLRRKGNEVAAASADCASVPTHILSPVAREVLSLSQKKETKSNKLENHKLV